MCEYTNLWSDLFLLFICFFDSVDITSSDEDKKSVKVIKKAEMLGLLLFSWLLLLILALAGMAVTMTSKWQSLLLLPVEGLTFPLY